MGELLQGRSFSMQVLQIFSPYFGLEHLRHSEIYKQSADPISVEWSHSPSMILFGLVGMLTKQLAPLHMMAAAPKTSN